MNEIIFLGGILLDSQIAEIEINSKIPLENAADSLQRSFLKGMVLNTSAELKLINIPFIGSFPRAYKKFMFPAVTDLLFGKIPVLGMKFNNIAVFRNWSRRRAAYRALNNIITTDKSAVIVIYSAHLPFIRAAISYRKKNTKTRICLIVPDFIQHMADYQGFRRVIAHREADRFESLLPEVDYFVTLTSHMAEKMNLRGKNYVVIEGMHDGEPDEFDNAWPGEAGPIFIYTGTLEKRYGILDLLAAFSQLKTPSAQLWICGDGDARAAVEDLARRDARVTYYGRVPRATALALQARAHVMVNPRRPEGEFTRYSFPSKTMEYLASGRPVIMHWLPGIPEEYRPWLITPETGDAAGLAATMAEVTARPTAELQRIGAAGRAFVLNQKSPRIQVGRLLDGLFPDRTGTD